MKVNPNFAKLSQLKASEIGETWRRLLKLWYIKFGCLRFLYEQNMYPKSIEKLDMNSLEVIKKINSMNYSSWKDLQCAQHEVAKSSGQPKRYHIDFTKNCICKNEPGLEAYMANKVPLTKVRMETYLTILRRVGSPCLKS